MQSALAGDPEAWDRIVRRLSCVRRILASLAFRRGVRLQEHELDDLAQDTLTRILSKLATFRGDATLETWAYKFCLLHLMNHSRKRTRELQALDELSEEPVAPESVAASAPDLQQFLRHLTAREADVVKMRFEAGLKLEEIAEALGVSPSTVKTCYYRALTKLRERFGDYDAGDLS